MYYKNGIVFNSQQAIRNDNKDTSLPMFMTEEFVTAFGYIPVVDGVKPTPSAVQYVVEGSVTLVAGVPTQSYILQDMFADTASYTDINGVVVPAKTKAQNEAEYLAKLQADAVSAMVQHFTDVTTQYIEGKVQAYNRDKGLAFKDIDAFTKYAINSLSQHYAIANRFINYADAIWFAVRTYQATATAVPTDIEFKAILDAVVF